MACGHYSVTDAMRCGQDICYYQNSIKRKQGDFDMYDSDTVYFALQSIHLNNYLNRITADPRKRGRVRVLCQSIAGNNIGLLTITSFQSDPESIHRPKGIVLMSRVHPGETMLPG